MSKCQHIEIVDSKPVHCRAPGREVRLSCPAGRPDAVGCYCDEHGGEPRARQRAESDWNYLAPASVGSAEDVEHAGTDCLRTPEAYVVVRQCTPGEGGGWLAWLGLGGHLTRVANPDGLAQKDRRRLKRLRDRGLPTEGLKLTPAYRFPDRDGALTTAIAAWRERVDRRVREITELRGGTLDWGTPVEPLPEPIVIELAPGDRRTAWDVAKLLPRRSAEGAAALTGLRPSGETF